MLEHCSWWKTQIGDGYDPRVVARIVEKGIHANLQRRTSVEVLGDETALARERPRHVPWRDMVRQGVKVIPSTDACGSREGLLDPLHVVMVSAVKLLEMSPMDALVACTGRAARVLGMEEEIGILEPGRAADFVVLSGDPLDDIFNLTKISHVFVRGEEVVVDGRVVSGR
jgi:imidazolonepropionase-like amidohydrolase